MRILIPFSHRIRISHFFAFSHYFCIFCAFFSHFSQLFGEISTKKVEKVQKCEKSAKSAMQMQNANAMRKQCDAMSFYKKCECECDAKKFSHYHRMRCEKVFALPSLLLLLLTANFLTVQKYFYFLLHRNFKVCQPLSTTSRSMET